MLRRSSAGFDSTPALPLPNPPRRKPARMFASNHLPATKNFCCRAGPRGGGGCPRQRRQERERRQSRVMRARRKSKRERERERREREAHAWGWLVREDYSRGTAPPKHAGRGEGEGRERESRASAPQAAGTKRQPVWHSLVSHMRSPSF